MSARNTFWAFVLGAAAGGAAALLLAPDRGERTRRRLLEGVDKRFHDVKDTVEHTAKELGHEVGARREAVAEAVHTAKETYHRELEKKAPGENRIASLTD